MYCYIGTVYLIMYIPYLLFFYIIIYVRCIILHQRLYHIDNIGTVFCFFLFCYC